MYIKLKLETNNQNERKSSEDSFFIEISNDATIGDAKKNIEDYVDLYAHDQIVKNLNRILHDQEKFIEVFDFDNGEGSSLMLFNQNDKFVCFLQLYSDAEAARQLELQKQSKEPSFYKNMPTTLVSLLDESDDNEGSIEDTESSSSSENSDSSSSSDGEDEKDKKSHGRKRNSKPTLEQIPAKKRLFTHHSELVTKYLEELPNYNEGIISSTTPKTGKKSISNEKPNTKEQTSSSETDLISSTLIENKAVSRSSTDSSVTLTPINSESQGTHTTSRKPCVAIAPEMRKFIAIVATDNCQEFLSNCLIEFERSDSTSNLQFDSKMPIVMHTDGNLWIACIDDYTLEWLLKNITSSNNTGCTIKKLLQSFDYHPFAVVLPKFQGGEKSLSEQFQLLEHQNKDLNTEKWIVEQHYTIENENDEFFDRKVSVLCQNEIIFLQIDLESEKYLEKCHFQLKYCFWKIHFQNRSDEIDAGCKNSNHP